MRGYAASFARGCVFRQSLSQSSTRRGFRFNSLIVGATGLPRPRMRPIANLLMQVRFSGPCPLRTRHLYLFHVAASSRIRWTRSHDQCARLKARRASAPAVSGVWLVMP